MLLNVSILIGRLLIVFDSNLYWSESVFTEYWSSCWVAQVQMPGLIVVSKYPLHLEGLAVIHYLFIYDVNIFRGEPPLQIAKVVGWLVNNFEMVSQGKV